MKRILVIFAVLFLTGTVYSQTYQKIKLGFGNGHKVKFSPSSDQLAFSVGKKVKLFRSGTQMGSFSQHSSKVNGLAFDSDGQYVMAGYLKGHITIWNTRTKEIVQDFKTANHPVIACQFLESPKRIVVLSPRNLSFWTIEGELISEKTLKDDELRALAVSTYGQLIATGGKSGIVKIWNEKGDFLRDIEVGHDWILSLSLSPKGKKLTTGTSDGTINLWNVQSGKLNRTMLKASGRINSLEFSNDGNYLAAGSESFYILSVDEEHPDVVYRNLSGAVLSSHFSPTGRQVCIIEDLIPYARIYDISDLQIAPVFKFRDKKDNIAPQIYISNPSNIVHDRINISKDMIDIEGSIFDDFGVRNLAINGIKTPIRDNGKFVIKLPLTRGENQVSIEASDINGNASVKKFVINRRDDSEKYDPLVARNFLFVIGINDYQKWPTLNNAVKDGTDLAAILMNEYDFDLSNVTLLKDEQATQTNIYRGLRNLIEKVTPRDNVIIYFSGHGHFDEVLNEGFWIPVNANLESEGEYIPNSSILKIIENINSQHTFLMADACFSGSLFTESRRGGYIESVEKLKSRWGLASGRLEVVSDGSAGSNSPFARVLLNFLKESSKQEFAVSELIQYVKMEVSEESGQTPIGNHLRLSGDEGGEFIFRRTNPSPGGKGLNQEKQSP